ncbi:dentin sialophosphoprotein-like isoform X2 [Zootermopsis nevadensis]|uniref:dentin sialophosphoprotein-like isoform X2 n=1 Tax=Zootermopsis nevadensis TaxID=136037 RepID=UPI000B8E546E|nr:dentin sialophosphoprotein-like isoform X2 [Zootermopsis nevadensis]
MPAEKTRLRTARAILEQMGEQVASCPLGQILFRGADRLLWTVETSLQWFVESEEPHNNESSLDEMPRSQPVRPLPWALFLPLLMWLRLVNFGVKMVASLRGTVPPHPLQVVHFLRVRRRRLRALKYQGLQNFCSWQLAENRNKQAANQCVVLKVLSVGPLGTLLAFTGLGRVLSALRDVTSAQTGNMKAVAEESESSDDMEDMLQKINRICNNYTSDDDPDYEPHEEEEDSDDSLSSEDNENKMTECKAIAVSEDTAADANSQTTANTDLKHKTIVPFLESNMLVISSQDKNQSNDANHHSIVTTFNAADQANAETPHSIMKAAEAKTTNDVPARDQNEEVDDSSSTLSLDSAEGYSESMSQAFYSSVSSCCVTPELQATGPIMTQTSETPESVETHPMPRKAEASPMKSLDSLVSLLASEKNSDGSSISGPNMCLKDLEEDTKESSTFSKIFQIKRKS